MLSIKSLPCHHLYDACCQLNRRSYTIHTLNQSLVAMVVDNAPRIALPGGECLRVSVEEEQARELLVCGVLLTWLLAPVVL